MPALSASDEHRRRRRALLAVGLLALAAAGLRVPFMWTGIGADEGGYAFIAHEWAHGAHLYRDLFVDRPQGLMLLYRALTDVAYQAWAIRLGAVICGALLTLIMAALGAMLGTRVTALCAATIFAVAGVAPRIEGFTMEGELAAAVPAAAAVACAVRWRGGDGDTGRPVRGDRWLAAAGAFGAVAMLMKQSGFDGLAVAVLVAVAAAGPLRTRARRGGLVVCGALIPFAAAAVHGISLGWRDYWFGIYGWRAQQDLGRSLGGRISELVHALPQIAPDVWGMALVAAAGVVVCLSRRRALWIAPVWLGVCVVALNAGGLYLPHYFIQLLAPLALLAALGASAVYARTRPLGIGLVLLSVA
ncbi:MAG: hypothetical protein JOZ25_10870, partial [Actinobacteria bacterium]|nr:hypothetical protein [Actinomycetota bacterium]